MQDMIIYNDLPLFANVKTSIYTDHFISINTVDTHFAVIKDPILILI
jgi:hypothetical protein